ncbi:MAG: MG2 domain-containing protein [Chloroflexota bacterium]
MTVEPGNESEAIAPTTPISITFSMPMDHAATEAAVALDPAADVSYTWDDDSRVLSMEPDELLALGARYTVSVSTAAASAVGGATLEEPFASTFTTVPYPAVKETMPGPGEVASQWQTGFSVSFASPMDTDTVQDQFIIEPDPGDVDYYINSYEGTYDVYVSFPLTPNVTYTVTIPGDAADPYGNTLGEDYTWSFSAPPYSSLASLNLPVGVAQLTTAFPTSVEVLYRNINGFDIALYNSNLDVSLLFNTYQQFENPPVGEPVFQTTVPATAAQDELGLASVDLAGGGTLPTGMYRLLLSSPDLVSEDVRWWQNQNVILIVADTNLVVKEMFGEVHVWATDLETGEPVSDRNLTLYNNNGAAVGTAVTDADGFASFDYDSGDSYLSGVAVVSNEPGQEGFGVALSNWYGSATPWEMGVSSDSGQEQALYAYIYTDRPIYRPGDTVYFKGVVRDTNFGRYTIPTEVTELELNLNPAFYYGEEQFSDTMTVALDGDGVFTGEYQLPDDMQLGTWSFSLTGDYWLSTRNFTVAEYRRPEFLVTTTADPAETVRGEPASVAVNGTYLFGAPAGGLPVNWTAYETTYYPTIETIPPFAFGDQGGYFYEPNGPFSGFGGTDSGTYVADGNGETDAAGNMIISLPGDLLDEADPGSRQVTVETTVGGAGEFPVTGSTTIVYHAADAYVGLATDTPVIDAGDDVAIDLLTVDWAGDPVANYNVDVTLYQRDWEQSRNADFGFYYTEWTPVDTEIDSQSVTSDANGHANVIFTTTSGGTYLVVATLTDSAGREQTSSISLWAVDPGYAGWRSDPNQRTMDLVPDKDSYAPGETAEILVQSPFAQPVQAWLTIERGNLLDQQVVEVNGSTVLQIPITADYAPNVHITVVAVKPVNPDDPDFPYADIRMGIVELPISIEQLTLDVELTPGQETYEPGDTADFTVSVMDYQGNPVPAEVSLALVDLAVLSLKEDNAPPIAEAFYSPQPLRSNTGSGLFITGEGLEVEEPLQGGGMGGGGGDAAAVESVRIEDEDGDVRQDFKDTAYWEAKLQLDGSGQASVEVPLPDNVTTWRMHSKAVGPDTLVGQNSADIQARLPLLIRPVTPRFFTVGDEISLGANINNNTSEDIEATVSLEAAGIVINGDAEQTVTVPANGRALVRWPVTVSDVPYADLTFRVSGGGYTDASKPTVGNNPNNLVPVYRYSGRDFVATAGELDESGRRVEALVLPEGVDTNEGSVVARLQPSLAAAIIESFEVFNDDLTTEMLCAGTLADRLLNNTATEQAVRELGLDEPALLESLSTFNAGDVTRLEEMINSDGGWSWCFNSESDPWLSAQALLALGKAQNLGYPVTAEILQDASLYVEGKLESVNRLNDASDVNRQAFFLYVLAEAGNNISGDADELVGEHRTLLDPYAKALLAMAYELSGASGENQSALLTDLNNSVIMSATGAHWEDAEQDVANLSSDIRGTAMVIDALSLLQPDSPLLPPAVRWLMVARTAETWSSAHQTAWSVLALGNWMAASGELDANYDYQLNVNLQPQADGTFTSDTLTTSEVVAVPVDQLFTEDTNYFDFQRGEGDGRLYYTLTLDSAIAVDQLDPVDRGMTVVRQYFDAACDPETEACQPLTEIAADQRVRVQLTVVIPEDRIYVTVEDPIPAGTEAIDPNLLTSASGTGGSIVPENGDNAFGYWGWWYFDNIQYGDEKVTFLSQYLPAGTYQYTYYLDAAIPGTYQVRPATAREQYFPEVFGRSDGLVFTITE